MQCFGSNLTFNFDYCQLIFQMSSHSEVFKYSIPSVHKVKTSNSLRETCADLPDCVTESVCFCFLAGPFRDKGKQEVFKRPKISAHCVSQWEQKAKVELHFPPKLFYSLSLCTKHMSFCSIPCHYSLQMAAGHRCLWISHLPLNWVATLRRHCQPPLKSAGTPVQKHTHQPAQAIHEQAEQQWQHWSD